MATETAKPKESKNKSTKDLRKTTKIVSCKCKHDYQDKKYGAGKRVANLSRKHNIYRCTVCSLGHVA